MYVRVQFVFSTVTRRSGSAVRESHLLQWMGLPISIKEIR